MSEKFSSFDRMVGVSKEEEEYLQKKARERFEDQSFEELEGKEQPKTPEEGRIIKLANSLTDRIREKYGLEGFDIPKDNIHVIDSKQWVGRIKTGGLYSPSKQAIYIRDDLAYMVFSRSLTHELLHFKSYNALQKRIGEEKFSIYRMGLITESRKDETFYFDKLTEAVTEELAKKYISEIWTDPVFEDELKETKRLKEKYPEYDDEDMYWLGEFEGENGEKIIKHETFAYKEERKDLLLGIEKLFKENSNRFQSKEEVWDIFFKAMLDGKLISLGKLIDKTFGKGSFRKMGEGGKFSDIIENKKK